jgi:predicted  nucleic acid-binding Zn-ribbon protein
MANGICSAIDELQNLRQENKQLILERESLRREITELELKLSQYRSLLDKGFDIINDHLYFSHGVWLDKATKLLQEEE